MEISINDKREFVSCDLILENLDRDELLALYVILGFVSPFDVNAHFLTKVKWHWGLMSNDSEERSFSFVTEIRRKIEKTLGI